MSDIAHFEAGGPPPMWIGDDRHLYAFDADGQPQRIVSIRIYGGLTLTADDLPNVRPRDMITMEPAAGVWRVVRHRATWWLLGGDRRTTIREVAASTEGSEA